MKPRRRHRIAASLLALSCAITGSLRAEDAVLPLAMVKDVALKGVVGKVLDAVPMDPDHRIVLQRTNAVVSGTLTGRSLSVWAGLTNPVLLIGGLVWGIFSASKIVAEDPEASGTTTRLGPAAEELDLDLPLELEFALAPEAAPGEAALLVPPTLSRHWVMQPAATTPADSGTGVGTERDSRPEHAASL